MTVASDNLFPKVILEETATDGSDHANPAADHRKLFLGEDGNLHLKDSAGTVTDVGGGSGAVATDAIWDAAGDLAVGSGANTAAKLAIGATDGMALRRVAGAVAWQGFVGAKAYNNGTQSISYDTATAVTFDSEDFDTHSVHDTGSNTSRFTIPANMTGKWLFQGSLYYEAATTGFRYARFRLNGSTVLAPDVRSHNPNSNSPTLTVLGIYQLTAADYLELMTYHTYSSGALTIGHASSRPNQSEVACQFLGP